MINPRQSQVIIDRSVSDGKKVRVTVLACFMGDPRPRGNDENVLVLPVNCQSASWGFNMRPSFTLLNHIYKRGGFASRTNRLACFDALSLSGNCLAKRASVGEIVVSGMVDVLSVQRLLTLVPFELEGGVLDNSAIDEDEYMRPLGKIGLQRNRTYRSGTVLV